MTNQIQDEQNPSDYTEQNDKLDNENINLEGFKSLGLPDLLLERLEKLKFTTPTPIQKAAIPVALQGHDILGTAQTGTGKTAAFALPILARLMQDPSSAALILTPTRELALQIMQQVTTMVHFDGPQIHSALIIGGAPMDKQLQQLRRKPRLIIGTPGRVNDHLRRNTIPLNKFNILVLDETDRMLDMGFSEQIEAIVETMPQARQTLLFSATLPRSILAIANSYLKSPQKISVAAHSTPAQNISQVTLRLQESEKFATLVENLNEREGTVIIFAKTKFGTEKLAKRLNDNGFSADSIHGDLRQSRRERVIANYRKKKFRVLVATDVAARGLDVPHIEHVINYDLPQVAEDYIHRIGRTARAGAQGEALNFVAAADSAKWRAIERLLDPSKAQSSPKSGRNRKFDDEYREGRRSPRKPQRRSREQEDGFSQPRAARSGFAGKPNTFGKKRRNDQPNWEKSSWQPEQDWSAHNQRHERDTFSDDFSPYKRSSPPKKAFDRPNKNYDRTVKNPDRAVKRDDRTVKNPDRTVKRDDRAVNYADSAVYSKDKPARGAFKARNAGQEKPKTGKPSSNRFGKGKTAAGKPSAKPFNNTSSKPSNMRKPKSANKRSNARKGSSALI